MCWSQQPQSPTWNLEPRQPGGRWRSRRDRLQGRRSPLPSYPRPPPTTPPPPWPRQIHRGCDGFPRFNSHPVGDLNGPHPLPPPPKERLHSVLIISECGWRQLMEFGRRGGGWRWKKHTLSHLFTYPGELTSDMVSGAGGER